MNAEMQPLYWRLQNNDNSGFDAVSLLMPAAEGEPATLVPTEVSFCSRRSGSQDVDVRWTEEDSDLFLQLLDRVSDDHADETDEGVVLDINDGVVQGIVQLVALARFKTPWPSDELVAGGVNTVRDELEIGDLVGIHTHAATPMAIVVGMDSIDLTCILLEDIEVEGKSIVPEHSVFVINRDSALPPEFAESYTDEEAVLH